MKDMKNNKKDDKVKDPNNVIYKLRMKHNLTQKEFASRIGVSDRTVSRWESDQTNPDIENIKDICREFGVSPASLVNSRITPRDVITDIKNKVVKLTGLCIKNIFLIVFIVAFFILLIYCLNNYNSVSVSTLGYDSKNINIEHGYFIKTKVLNILIIDDISLVKLDHEPNINRIDLYTYVNGDKYILYSSDTLEDIYIEELKGYPNIFQNDVIESIKHHLYLDIIELDKDNKPIIHNAIFSIINRFKNDKLSYENFINDIKDERNYYTINPNIKSDYNNSINMKYNLTDKTVIAYKDDNTVNILISLGFVYDKDEECYYKNDDDGGVFKFKSDSYTLEYIKVKKDVKYYYKYIFNNNYITIKIIENTTNKTISYFNYMIDTKEKICLEGSCENYQQNLDSFLNISNEIKTTY